VGAELRGKRKKEKKGPSSTNVAKGCGDLQRAAFASHQGRSFAGPGLELARREREKNSLPHGKELLQSLVFMIHTAPFFSGGKSKRVERAHSSVFLFFVRDIIGIPDGHQSERIAGSWIRISIELLCNTKGAESWEKKKAVVKPYR
jgi:hypothetical protein